jgi:hypothetical protein
MTAHQSNRRWRLLLGLPMVAGLLPVGPAFGAVLTAASTSAPLALTWSTVSPPATPPPLAYASAVYDSDNKTVVLFGGVQSNGQLSNDTWVWNGSTWADFPATVVQAPPARRMAAMAFDPKLHQLILFGGQGADGQPLGDTWAWNGASWYQETDELVSHAPSAREGAAMGYDGAGHLILFGGTGLSGASAPTTTTTTTTAPPTASSPAAPAGGVTTAASAPASELTVLSDTWVWSGDGWGPTTTPGPSPRSGAALAVVNPARSGALLFGGESTPAGSTSPKLLDDSWAWNGTSWGRVASTAGPPARDHAVVSTDGLSGGVVAFGGAGTAGALNDTWLWNGVAWSRARTTGAPSPRLGAAAAFDSSNHQLLVFGGVGPGGVVLGDTVVLTGQTPVILGTGSAPAAGPTRTAGPTTSSSSSPSRAKVTTPASSASTSTTTSPAGARGASPAPLIATGHVLHRGDLVKLEGDGFQPGTAIVITFHSSPTLVGRAVADSKGAFTATVGVPTSAAGGTHHFDAAGLNRAGQIADLVATVDVIGVPATGASTATQRAVLTAIAFSIPAATWGGLVAVGWWRRRGAAVS